MNSETAGILLWLVVALGAAALSVWLGPTLAAAVDRVAKRLYGR